jgi:uroporphyrinogen decarboxylase
LFAYRDAAAFDVLIDVLVEASASYLVRQLEAGADAVQIFDSWAGLLSVKTWQRLIRPHLQRLLDATADLGVPRILFLQNAPHLVASYAGLPAEVLGVDWRVELGDLQRLYPDRALQGNLEPAILTAGPAATRAAARELLADVAPRGHIVNLGHGILPQTPLASVDALVEVVHSEKL